MSKVLIYEKLNDVKTLEKGRGEDGFMRMKGIFGVCGVVNQNKRIYETSNYKSMVDKLKSRIAAEGVPGQLEHPQTMNIDLNEISHVIEDINIDEKGVVTGTIKLLNTPKGKIAQALVEGGLPLFISSRATGTVDKNTGKVTLEELKTYDLVGTPGFSQARLNIAESLSKELGNEFVTESFDDNMFIVEAKENKETNKETEFNMTEQEHKDLLEKLDLLEQKVAKANEAISEFNSPERMRPIAEAIQNWIINEYSPSLQSWVLEEASEGIKKTISESMMKPLADGIQNWMINEMAPEIQGWVMEHYSKEMADGIQGWMLEEVTPMVNKWITEEYSKTITNWIAEEYTPTLDKYITEHLQPALLEQMKGEIATIKESKESKLASIDNLLNMISESATKPVIGQINEDVNPNDPLYIREMPASARPLWESADDNMKAYIQRKAHLFSLNTPESIEKFWEGIDWKKSTPATPVYENLDQYQDNYEKQLRARLRNRR